MVRLLTKKTKQRRWSFFCYRSWSRNKKFFRRAEKQGQKFLFLKSWKATRKSAYWVVDQARTESEKKRILWKQGPEVFARTPTAKWGYKYISELRYGYKINENSYLTDWLSFYNSDRYQRSRKKQSENFLEQMNLSDLPFTENETGRHGYNRLLSLNYINVYCRK